MGFKKTENGKRRTENGELLLTENGKVKTER